MSRKVSNIVALLHLLWGGFQLAVIIMMTIGAVGLSSTIEESELIQLWVTIASTFIIIILSLISSFCLALGTYDEYNIDTRIKLVKVWLIISVLDIIFSALALIFVSETKSEKISSLLNLGFLIVGGIFVLKYLHALKDFKEKFLIPSNDPNQSHPMSANQSPV